MALYLFILSTKAGKGSSLDYEKEIISTFKKADLLESLEIYKTENTNSIKSITRNFSLKKGTKYLYICGGDGSFNEALDAVINSDIILGLIPAGSANDFSKNFNYQNFNFARCINPEVKKIDCIRVNDSYALNVLSFGYDNIILEKAYNLMRKYHFLGTKAFKLAAITSIFNLKYYDLKVHLDDSSYFDGNSLFALVCNAPYYGASFMPSPYSIIDDGFIELILVKKINSLNFIKLMPLYKKGKHLSSKYVKNTSFKKARIMSDKMLVANCDGEIFKTKELNIEILEKVINLAYIADYNRS